MLTLYSRLTKKTFKTQTTMVFEGLENNSDRNVARKLMLQFKLTVSLLLAN